MTGRQPKVLLHAFSTFALGGAQARVVALANAWARQDAQAGVQRYRHLIMAMDGHYEAGERLDAAVDWEPLRMPVQRGAGLANRAAFRRTLQTLRPELLLTYNWGAVEWAAGNWPRVVPQLHIEDGFGPDEAVAQLPRRMWTRRVLLGLAGVPLAVPSRRLADLASSWWIPAHRVFYVPNGVALSALPPRTTEAPGARPLVVGTVAGLRPEKNLARLIKAFAQLRRTRAAELVLVGEGAERTLLEALATELGVAADVTFTGYVTNPRDFIRRFDLLALSSDTEQQPLALLEAMAEGVPVISTRVGDVPHMVAPEAAAACLCEPNDEAFARTLLAVVAQSEQWPAWAAAGRARAAEHYSFERMLRGWDELHSTGRLNPA
jgi:glycosyltransferase involved in cell wall biosynthesis